MSQKITPNRPKKDKLKAVFPMRYKMAFFISIVATIPLALLGYNFVNQSEVTLEESHLSLQRSVATDLSHVLTSTFDLVRDNLDRIGHIFGSTQIKEENRIPFALQILSGSEQLRQVAVYDKKGFYIDALEEENNNNKQDFPEEILEATLNIINKNGFAMLNSALKNESSYYLLLLPISDRKQQISGYIAGFIPLDPLKKRVFELRDEYFSSDPESILIADQNRKNLITNNKKLNKYEIFNRLDPKVFEQHILQNGEFSIPSREIYISTLLSQPNFQMVIVVQERKSIAFAPIDQLKLWILYAFAIAILIALFFAFLISRSLSAPLEKLTEMSLSLANRDFSVRNEITTNDEVGILAQAMNQAAQDLLDSEEQMKKDIAIRQDLGRYLPQEIVEKVIQRKQNMQLGGERKEVTVLFADVVSFTPLIEKLSPEDCVLLLNELFTFLTEIVFKNHGMIDKFMGDGIMVIFGAPESIPQDADHALSAARDMLRWLKIGNRGWKERFGVTLELAIGINSGEAVIGNVGSESRMEYTAIGETVNYAAHLENVAQAQQILVSEQTYAKLENNYDLLPLGQQQVREKLMNVYALNNG